jgi:hypothetical protein
MPILTVKWSKKSKIMDDIIFSGAGPQMGKKAKNG